MQGNFLLHKIENQRNRKYETKLRDSQYMQKGSRNFNNFWPRDNGVGNGGGQRRKKKRKFF